VTVTQSDLTKLLDAIRVHPAPVMLVIGNTFDIMM
jgi:hypothetical protein